MQSLRDYFERVVCINLDRRSDRWEQVQRNLSDIEWPFRQCERFGAVDGALGKPPAWWRAGGGAWGCLQSHLRVIERAVMDGVSSILILEDDACFPKDFRERAARYLSEIPNDWQQIYLGGQHLRQNVQAPEFISNNVCRPFNVNRTHAYALRGDFLVTVYRWLSDYVAHAQNPQHHIDHRFGSLHETRRYNVYAPREWIVGQDEGYSDIRNASVPARFWAAASLEDKDLPDLVAVIGLHRSGSSCLAGMLHKLGVHMGDHLTGYEKTGGFEAIGLARLCEAAYPFPSTQLHITEEDLRERLRAHIRHVRISALNRGLPLAGVKYPHLCVMGELLREICGDHLRIIHINRPIEASIRSLQARSQKSSGCLRISNQVAEQVQHWLWDSKQRFLATVNHLTLQYDQLATAPSIEIKRAIQYLQIEPTEMQRKQSVGHMSPELHHY
jgi:hypothetical protein